MRDLDDAFFDDFWENIDATEDDGISAVRLIGELLATNVLYRYGDDLCGSDGMARLALNTNDQFLVRRIEDAANAAIGGDR